MMRSRIRPAVASVTIPSRPSPTSMRRMPLPGLPLLPRHQQHHDPGVAAGIADLGLGADAPGAADRERHLGLAAIPDGGQRHHGDLGPARRAEPLDQVLHPRLRRRVDDAGDVGDVAFRLRGKEPSDLGLLGEAGGRGAQLKRRHEGDSFGSCPAQDLSWRWSWRPSLPARGPATSPSACPFPDPIPPKPRPARVGLVALPYDRDSVLAALEASAPLQATGHGGAGQSVRRVSRRRSTRTRPRPSERRRCADSLAQVKSRLDSLPRNAPEYAKLFAAFERLSDSLSRAKRSAEAADGRWTRRAPHSYREARACEQSSANGKIAPTGDTTASCGTSPHSDARTR